MKIKKILIANRGEIAVRIIRTCKELGIATVAVYSTADKDALHVLLADESVCIGPPRATESYLKMESVISAALVKGACAIHPGFGFLSENARFVELCHKHDLLFIGPNPKVMLEMGEKIKSKELAFQAGIPVLRPIAIKDRPISEVVRDIEKMGLPVLIKASCGGGGKGMQVVKSIDKLNSIIARMKAESKAAFGDDTLFIEKYIESSRHIEVQIVADQHGNVVHLGERDCTVQRRYQKLVEESPASVLTEELRDEICSDAVKLSRFVGYDSVGTVEFLYDLSEEKYYFMEMNTRIQVEHPVTEVCTGVDLIAEQINTSSGERLELVQDSISFNGHAVECRINAEHPETGAPSPGKISEYFRPEGEGIRIDDFIYSGYTVTPYYDSMLAKVIVHANTREEALELMDEVLLKMKIKGIDTNIDLHRKIIGHKNFKSSKYTTSFLKDSKIQG